MLRRVFSVGLDVAPHLRFFCASVIKHTTRQIERPNEQLIQSLEPHSEQYVSQQLLYIKKKKIQANTAILNKGTILLGFNLHEGDLPAPGVYPFMKTFAHLTPEEIDHLIKLEEQYPVRKVIDATITQDISCVVILGDTPVFLVHPSMFTMSNFRAINQCLNDTFQPRK